MKFRKALTILLALSMVRSLLPTAALAQDAAAGVPRPAGPWSFTTGN